MNLIVHGLVRSPLAIDDINIKLQDAFFKSNYLHREFFGFITGHLTNRLFLLIFIVKHLTF